MGSLYIPTCNARSVLVGNVSSSVVTTAPLIFIKIDGIIYANGYRFNTVGGYRSIFGSYVSSTGNVYLNSYTFAVTDTVPAWSSSNVEVMLIA